MTLIERTLVQRGISLLVDVYRCDEEVEAIEALMAWADEARHHLEHDADWDDVSALIARWPEKPEVK